MQIKEQLQDTDRIRIIEKRFELITVAKYRDKTKIKKAMKIQDKIREGTKGVTGLTEEIRKWRDLRYAPSS
jgi:hypothetical protein